MIRVLNVVSDTNIGGVGRVILNYLPYADKERFDIHTVVPRGSLLVPELKELKATIHEIDGIADRSYAKEDVALLKTLIREIDPDIVHTHGALSGRIAGKQCGKIVIYTRHSAFPVPAKLRYPPGRWVNKWMNERYADRIIAVSPAAAQNLTDSGVSARKITTMMNGVTPLSPAPRGLQDILRVEFGITSDDFVMGILARIEDYKGHLDIVNAARILKDEQRQFKILMAGTGTFEEELRQNIKQLDLEDCILMLGFRSDITGLLSILDCQLNASYGTETSSLALLEGMSLGLPSIASDYGGNPVLVTPEQNGLLFPTRDYKALARCMARMMDEPDFRKKTGNGAREIFFKRYTAEIFARNVEAVYDDALKHNGRNDTK